QFARRAGNDSQHLRGRGLLLQRLAQIVRTLAQLVEQAAVLDGDDGLGGEVLDQLDLLVGEGANLLAVNDNAAHQLLLSQHRYGKYGPSPGVQGNSWVAETRRHIEIARFGLDVGDLNSLFDRHRAAERSLGAGADHWFAPTRLSQFSRCPMQGHTAKSVSVG